MAGDSARSAAVRHYRGSFATTHRTGDGVASIPPKGDARRREGDDEVVTSYQRHQSPCSCWDAEYVPKRPSPEGKRNR